MHDFPASPSRQDPAPQRPPRIASIDIYRGLVMFLMSAELLDLPGVAAHFPGNTFWEAVRSQTEHVAWTGCSLHDLIQPSFSFLVGVALTFSIASRMAKGQAIATMALHAVWRAFALVMLGVLLRSLHHPRLQWTFEDTLTQIGLGYPLLFALGFAGTRARWAALVAIVLGYWALFALYPAPGPAFDYTAAGVPAGWAHHASGFASHWNLNANAAWAFDRWFLNLFPRGEVFIGHEEGYSTLSFIPTLGTMILGLLAGEWLRHHPAQEFARRCVLAAAAGFALGWAWHFSGLCPSIKKLWTPSWTLFSGGWCFLILAALHWIADARGWRRWALPFTVLGANSIAMYVLVHVGGLNLGYQIQRLLGRDPFLILGEPFAIMLNGAAVLLLLWLLMGLLYRRRWFIRI